MGVWLLAPTRSPNPNPNPNPNSNPNSKSDPINADRYANPNLSPSPNANPHPHPHPDQVVKENAWAEQYGRPIITLYDGDTPSYIYTSPAGPQHPHACATVTYCGR